MKKDRLFSILIIFMAIALIWASGGGSSAIAAGSSAKYGHTLTRAYYAPGTLDPAFAADVTADELARYWADFLVYVDEQVAPDQNRSLAHKWENSADGLTWTFHLRKGVTFHNGEKLTSKDVKFTFDRLRDPDVGAATVGLFAGIIDISTPDNNTVVFKLKNKNPDFLTNLGDYHSPILWHGIKDPKKEQIGTGAFMVEKYIPEDRMIFKRNPNYWRKDSEGNQLPYLDGIVYLFLSEPSAQVEALRGGQVDYLMYLPPEHVKSVENDPNLVVYQKPSNTHYIIHMRSDRKPFSDVRVRQAVKSAIDRKSILIGAFEGLGVTGRDSFLGPAFSDFYLDVPEIERDVKKAKKLLSDAGYSDGLNLTLVAQQSGPIPAIATIVKEQVAAANINVEIQMMPSDVYYGSNNTWLETDFSITDWGSRASPQNYLDLAYTCNAKWNESHWCDAEVDKLSAAAASEMDRKKRAEIYKRIQTIFMERGPIIVPFFNNNLWGANKNVKGMIPSGYLGTALDIAVVYIEK